MALEGAPRGGAVVPLGAPLRAQYLGAFLVGLGLVASALAALPYIRTPMASAIWFIPTSGAIILLSGISASYLLSRQARAYYSPALAALVAAYLLMTVCVVVQTLAFEGIFRAGHLLESSPDTAGYLYYFWHAGFLVWIAVYLIFASVEARTRERIAGGKETRAGARRSAAMIIPMIYVAALVVMILVVTISLQPGFRLFPHLAEAAQFARLRTILLAVPTLLGAGVFCGTLARLRRGTIVDLWLSLAVLGTFLDTAFSLVGAPRFSLGWYLGRADAMAVALAIPIALSFQYARNLVTMRELSESLRAAAEFRIMAESIPQIVFTLHRRGRVEYMSAKWFELTGQERERIHEPQSWASALHPEDVDGLTVTLEQSMQSGEPFSVDGRVRLRDGSYRWYNARGLAYRDASGAVVKWYGTMTDIHQQRIAEDRARELYAREHHVAETLQRAFLPRFLPSVPGLHFDSVYRPNTEEANVGGDWYDAFELPGRTIAVSLGDVGGHGLDAAVTMGRVRETVRAAATVESDRPDLVLDRANRALLTSDPGVLVTALFGIIDPFTLRFTYATAGHPAPMLARRDGSVIGLEGGGVPLGVEPKAPLPKHDLFLEPGDFLAVYTDGLVESTRDVLAGEARLADALRLESARSIHTAAETIVSAVLAGNPIDDVALLTIAFDAATPGVLAMRVPAITQSAPLLRRELTNFLQHFDLTKEERFNLTLVVGEAVNNAVEHAYRGEGVVELRGFRFAGRLLLEVRDFGSWREDPPSSPEGPTDAERGRGLFLMRTLCEHYVVLSSPSGTRVRFGLPLGASSEVTHGIAV